MLSTPAWISAPASGDGPLSRSGSPDNGVVLMPSAARPSLAMRALEARQDAEHADRAGDRRRLGEDEIAGHRHPIAARCRDIAHRDDHRQLLAPWRRGSPGGSAPDAITEPPGLSMRTTSAFNLSLATALRRSLRRCCRRRRCRAGLAVDDLAGDGDDADRPVGLLSTRVADVGVELDPAVAALGAVVVPAADLGQPRVECASFADAGRPIWSPAPPWAMSPPAARDRRRPDRAYRRRSMPRGGARLGDVLAPCFEHGVAERLRIVARLGRHVAAGIGLDRRLVGADAIDVGGHPQLVEQALVIEIVAAGPGERHRAQRVAARFPRRGRRADSCRRYSRWHRPAPACPRCGPRRSAAPRSLIADLARRPGSRRGRARPP